MNPKTFATFQSVAVEPQKAKEERPPEQRTIEKGPNTTKVRNGERDKFTIVRSELNLEQNAVFTVSTYKKKSREIIIKNKNTERKIIIGKTRKGIETGILTIYHFKLYLALLELWEKAGKPADEPVNFTILKLIRQLGMANAGTNYERIKQHLIDLSQIPLTFIDSFYLSDKESFNSLKPFQILSYLDIYERKYKPKAEGQKTRGYGRFRFHDNILTSLINNYTHPLRLDIIAGFSKHRDLAILLYTYIDRNLAFKNQYEIGLEKLYEHLDLSQKYVKYPSYRKAKIEPVLEQLRGKELSTGIISYTKVLKTKDGKDYKLVCHKRPFPKRLKNQEIPPEFQLPPPTEPEPKAEPAELKPELLSLLTEKGLTEKQAAKLISEQQLEVIKAQLEYFPFRLKDYKAQGREINEPGILYDSIKGNWKAPKGHLNAEKEKEREARRLEEERIAQLEQKEQERQEKETAELEAYKESLDPKTRAKLREKAQQEIRSMKNIKEGFITEILINIKENDILRSEMEDDGLP